MLFKKIALSLLCVFFFPQKIFSSFREEKNFDFLIIRFSDSLQSWTEKKGVYVHSLCMCTIAFLYFYASHTHTYKALTKTRAEQPMKAK